MKKKLLISLSVVFGIVAVLLLLFWTLFGLSKVTVSFSTTLENLTVSKQEIIKVGKFRKGASVLFENKKKSIKRIEDYVSKNKNFAYIKIENIETVFPNKFVIHISEREELFAVSYEEKFLICDRDLRVLNILDKFESSQNNAILLEGLTIKNKTVEIGDFLKTEENSIKKLYSAFVSNNRNLNEQRSKFEKLELSKYKDDFTKKEYVSLELSTFAGRTFEIRNIDFALQNKVALMYATESAIFGQTVDEDGDMLDKGNKKVFFKKLETGEYVTFDEENDDEEVKVRFIDMLSNCKIRLDNFTLSEHISRDENDIYYSFVSM